MMKTNMRHVICSEETRIFHIFRDYEQESSECFADDGLSMGHILLVEMCHGIRGVARLNTRYLSFGIFTKQLTSSPDVHSP